MVEELVLTSLNVRGNVLFASMIWLFVIVLLISDGNFPSINVASTKSTLKEECASSLPASKDGFANKTRPVVTSLLPEKSLALYVPQK